jgi:hypothetical protein
VFALVNALSRINFFVFIREFYDAYAQSNRCNGCLDTV